MGGGSFDHDTPVDPVPVDADVAGVDWMGAGVDLTMAVAGLTEGAAVDGLTEGADTDLTEGADTDLTEGAGTDLTVGLADDWFATKPSVCTKSKTSTPRKTAIMVSIFCVCILLFK
jgi:hypothetical protein